MRDVLVTNLVKPLAGRLGTAGGTYLLTLGVTQDLSHQITAVVLAVACLSYDLVLSWLGRKEVARKVETETVERISWRKLGLDPDEAGQ